MNDKRSLSRRTFFKRLGLFGLIGLGTAPLGAARGTPLSPSRAPVPAASDGDVTKTVRIRPVDNEMQYRKTEFVAPAGEDIRIVLENTATSPAMKHNVVVLNTPPKQKFFEEVGQAGLQTGPSADFIPENHPAVLAATPLSEPGDTVEVTFTTPTEPGDYGYVCTYPGHWVSMQGTMHVTA